MRSASFTEMNELPEPGARLQDRALAGEYFHMRGALKKCGVLESMRQASLRGIRREMGDTVARQVEEAGFEHIHEVVSALDIPRITEAAYIEVVDLAPQWLRTVVPLVFGSDTPFYFERFPNVRFHIPYDLAAPHRHAYEEFTKKRGEGKITAHGPHRDSWLDCPTNAVNIWVAVGPVSEGNGMVVFPERYREAVGHAGCHVRKDERTGPATRIDMAAGDALVFHGDQLHASVLNYTSLTRHAISFRLALDKPVFPEAHLHNYAYSPLAVGPFEKGPLSWVAEIPAKLRPGYVTTRVKILRNRLLEKLKIVPPGADDHRTEDALAEVPANAEALSDLAPGQIRAVDKTTCVARLSDGSLVAFGRRCTHEAADLALGTIENDQVRCPWHGVPFDPRTGESPCKALKKLRLYDTPAA